jgi:hypothetical protein
MSAAPHNNRPNVGDFLHHASRGREWTRRDAVITD